MPSHTLCLGLIDDFALQPPTRIVRVGDGVSILIQHRLDHCLWLVTALPVSSHLASTIEYVQSLYEPLRPPWHIILTTPWWSAGTLCALVIILVVGVIIRFPSRTPTARGVFLSMRCSPTFDERFRGRRDILAVLFLREESLSCDPTDEVVFHACIFQRTH